MVFLDLTSSAGARVLRIAVVATRTGVERRNEGKIGGVGEVLIGTRNGNGFIF